MNDARSHQNSKLTELKPGSQLENMNRSMNAQWDAVDELGQSLDTNVEDSLPVELLCGDPPVDVWLAPVYAVNEAAATPLIDLRKSQLHFPLYSAHTGSYRYPVVQ